MAVASLPSFSLTVKSSELRYRLDIAGNKPFLGSSYAKFGSLKKNRNAGVRIFICKAAASSPSSSFFFPDLDADDFRHPLDKQNTLLLRAIPHVNEIVKTLLGSIAEEVMVLENIGKSILVSKNQLSELHQLMVQSAEILNIEAPDLYVKQNPVPNAYTLAINGKNPFVVVHTSLIELLSRNELQLGHLKCDHGVWLTVANILTLGVHTIPGIGGMIAEVLEDQLYRWLRAAELTCDRATLLVVQDPKVVISVLMKLAGGCPSLADQLNADAFLEQARFYDKASSNPVGWYVRNAQTRRISHPLLVLRAREIDEWSKSQDYKSLMKRTISKSSLQKS